MKSDPTLFTEAPAVRQRPRPISRGNRPETTRTLRSEESQGASLLTDPAGKTFSMREARSIVGNAFRPKPWVYWTDMLLSWGVAIASFKAVQIASLGLPLRSLAFVVSCLLIYRCGLFIHELMHLPERGFKKFHFAWNLLCGVPFLIPSFVYQTHLDHHRRKHYGTSHDGEYMPFSNRPVLHLIAYLGQSFVIPVLAVIRFGLITPLTWFNTPARGWVLRHMSSMVIDPTYLRPMPSKSGLRSIRMQEVACFLFILVVSFGVVRSMYGQGIMNPWFLLQAYLTGVCVLTINAVRTLGAHRYQNDAHANDDEPMTFVEQLLDSITYDRRPWLTILWAPMGTGYHALHHLFPTMPYHAMAEAHKLLMRDLPADSPYRKTVSLGLVQELRSLWKRAARSSA